MNHEFRMDDDGVLDEFVAHRANVHLERISDCGWYLNIAVGGRLIQFRLHLSKKHPVPSYEVVA